MARAAQFGLFDIIVVDWRDAHRILHRFLPHAVERSDQTIRLGQPVSARGAVHQIGVECIIVRLPFGALWRGDMVADRARDAFAGGVAILMIWISAVSFLRLFFGFGQGRMQ